MIYVDNHIEFKISDAGTLLSVTNFSNDPDIDVFVPKVLPCGNEINLIGRGFLSGRFNKVVFDGSFNTILPDTFRFANVKEVVWPSSCKEIPRCCFKRSYVEKVSNISNIEHIDDMAFHRSY